ncbi:MAG TPA: MFS transporter, partial [Allocoleopsis sp.]
IGVLDGLVFGIGLIAEIPSGALADLLGRKRQLQIGLLLMSAGFFMQGFAQAYWYILVGMIMFTVGMALVSGSDDALVYDSLDAEGKSNRWDKIIARKFQIMHIVTISSYLVGGLLYIMNFRLPFIMVGVGILFGFFVACTFKETREASDSLSMRAYVQQNTEGMKYLLRRHMWLYAFMAVVVLGIGYAFDLGVIKPLVLDAFGYHANAQAVINAIAGGAAIIALTQLDKLRKYFGEKRGLVLLALIMGTGFLAASFPIGKLGLLAFLAIFTVNSLIEPWLNDVVQQEVPSSHRATALSTLALLQKLPYVLLAPVAGGLSTSGHFTRFLVGIAICIFVAVTALLVFGILNNRIKKNKARQMPTIKEDSDV